MNDDILKELIIKQFKNIKVGEFNLDIEFEKKERKEYDNTNRVLDGKQGDFMRLILDIKKGKYSDIAMVDTENKTWAIKKKDICELININKRKLKERILDKPLVVNFLNNNKIEIQAQKIIIPYDNNTHLLQSFGSKRNLTVNR